MSANINGLRGKLDKLKLLAHVEARDIIACQDTKISSKQSDNSLTIDGYKLFRKDRNESGGGVALYVKNALKVFPFNQSVEENLELIATKIKLHNTHIIVATTYKPPRVPVSEFTDYLTSFLSSSSESNIVLTGDTNVCYLSPEFLHIQEICDTFELTQVIRTPTHNERVIDQIFASKDLTVHSAGIDSPIEKTHSQTWIKLSLIDEKSLIENKNCQSWNFKNVDWVGINLKLM